MTRTLGKERYLRMTKNSGEGFCATEWRKENSRGQAERRPRIGMSNICTLEGCRKFNDFPPPLQGGSTNESKPGAARTGLTARALAPGYCPSAAPRRKTSNQLQEQRRSAAQDVKPASGATQTSDVGLLKRGSHRFAGTAKTRLNAAAILFA